MAPRPDPPKEGISKTKLLLGAGALFLFIVGVKKSWPRPDLEDGEARDGGDGRDEAGDDDEHPREPRRR